MLDLVADLHAQLLDNTRVARNMLKYDTAKEGYVVPLDKDRLEDAPRYDLEQRPDYDDAYGRRVNDYYGVPYL